MKIATVVGARPQFIKAAAVSRALSKVGVREVLIHTGQHYDPAMSDVFFEQMEIPKPQYHLGIGGGLHGAMTGRQMEGIESVLLAERPDCVLVYGDTNSTLAGALAAAKLHIPVAHVEAGLRSFNRRMPEEVNRVLADHVSTSLFAPTRVAIENLAREGISGPQVCLVGDVMYDATIFFGGKARKPAWFDAMGLAGNDFVLCTIHRAENTDDAVRLRGIFEGLEAGLRPVLLPLHPRTRARLEQAGITPAGNVHITPPVGYLDMIWLEANCALVATDSGGVQKEAYFHQKPCVTMRDETEWVELVEIGANIIVGADPIALAQAIRTPFGASDFEFGLYGNGDASERIASALVSA